MNTTTTAPDPGYYVPTPADCLEAGMIQPDERCIFFWIDHTLPAPQQGEPDIRVYLRRGDRIAIYSPDGSGQFNAWFKGADGAVRPLVFTNRAACMAFLRNHIATAAEPVPDGYEVVPLVDKDGKFYKHIVIPIIDREANPQFKGKIVMSTSLEEMDEASAANARKMWDDSAPAKEVGGLTRTFTPKQDEGGAE